MMMSWYLFSSCSLSGWKFLLLTYFLFVGPTMLSYNLIWYYRNNSNSREEGDAFFTDISRKFQVEVSSFGETRHLLTSFPFQSRANSNSRGPFSLQFAFASTHLKISRPKPAFTSRLDIITKLSSSPSSNSFFLKDHNIPCRILVSVFT